jgi:NTE family protein
VTAPSAVPVVFDPVVVENFGGCGTGLPPWLAAAQRRDDDNPNLSMIVQADASYANRSAHRYAQFVDGGITDNLGLRAMLDAIELVGGARQYQQNLGIATPRRLAIISVNAAARRVPHVVSHRFMPKVFCGLSTKQSLHVASPQPTASSSQ